MTYAPASYLPGELIGTLAYTGNLLSATAIGSYSPGHSSQCRDHPGPGRF